MKLELRDLKLPDFGVPEEIPQIPNRVYEERCVRLYEKAKCDWIVIYGDKEHSANLHYLSGYDPRFEESLLLIGPKNNKYLLVGNEGLDYSAFVKVDIEIVLCQTFSLMGQDRNISPSLYEILKDIGIKRESRIGICGWKYLETNEQVNGSSNIFVPAMIVDCFKRLVEEPIVDVTKIMMHPSKGLRTYNEIEQIVAMEWGAARASAAVMKIINNIEVGMSEFQAVSNMGYAGEPLSTHTMFASGKDKIIGLSSPKARVISKGDGATAAVGYWGGLSCRAGLVDTEDEDFVTKFAIPYFRAVLTWYQTASIGVRGGDLFDKIVAVLAEGGLKPALNPGHLISSDEWLNTFIAPNSQEIFTSGMAFQCDIIPAPLPDGISINCEDSVIFADQELRNNLKKDYPNVWKRIELRRKFIREEIGLDINDDLLPLASNPAYFSPLWLSPGKALTLQ